MKKTDNWKNLRPVTWRSLGSVSWSEDEHTEEDQLDSKVREEGPGAFSHLMEIVGNDEAGSEVRCRAMGWLASLYGNPDIDKETVVEVLRNVVRSNLKPARSEPRRDALMALANLGSNAWDRGPDLHFLLELAGNKELTRSATDDVLAVLAETRAPEAIEPLALGILQVESQGLRKKLAKGLQEIGSVEWTDKAKVFVDLFEKHPIRSREVHAGAIVGALSDPQADARGRYIEIGNFFVEQSRNRNERVAGILGKLLIESQEGDQNQAGFRLNQYAEDHKIPATELEQLRLAVGGAPTPYGNVAFAPADVEAAKGPIFLISILGAFAGITFAAFGVWLVIVGSDEGRTTIDILSQTIETSNVGIAAIFIGAVTVIITLRRVLKSLDTAILK